MSVFSRFDPHTSVRAEERFSQTLLRPPAVPRSPAPVRAREHDSRIRHRASLSLVLLALSRSPLRPDVLSNKNRSSFHIKHLASPSLILNRSELSAKYLTLAAGFAFPLALVPFRPLALKPHPRPIKMQTKQTTKETSDQPPVLFGRRPRRSPHQALAA